MSATPPTDHRTAFVTGGSGFIGGRLVGRLVADGWTVRALARSDRSAEAVAALGAEPVRGDLDHEDSIAAGAEGCQVAFHAAAWVEEWGTPEQFERGNVDGTRHALNGARAAGVARFVHVGTEAALLAGEPLIDVDERARLQLESPAPYPATKARAEMVVRTANRPDFATLVVRPRLVWGPGDTTILPGVAAAVESGKFRWIGGGRHRTSTTHVDNVVEGLLLAAERGAPGGVWFVTDGEPIVLRDFITDLLATQGITPPDKDVPLRVANTAAAVAETAWRRLPLRGAPPITRMAVWGMGLETTIDISRAREELGYEPVRTIPDGLAELRAAAGR